MHAKPGVNSRFLLECFNKIRPTGFKKFA